MSCEQQLQSANTLLAKANEALSSTSADLKAANDSATFRLGVVSLAATIMVLPILLAVPLPRWKGTLGIFMAVFIVTRLTSNITNILRATYAFDETSFRVNNVFFQASSVLALIFQIGYIYWRVRLLMLSGKTLVWDALAGFMLLGLSIVGMVDRFYGGKVNQRKDGSWRVSYSDQWSYATDWLTVIYCIILCSGYFWYIRHKLGKISRNLNSIVGEVFFTSGNILLVSIILTFACAAASSAPAAQSASDTAATMRNMFASIGRNVIILDFAATCLLTSDVRREGSAGGQRKDIKSGGSSAEKHTIKSTMAVTNTVREANVNSKV
ncbi:hypothetical protein HK104_001138 [Borealophlyctis nickersoniae]|nr:hypothetical protein HK104_001138 [Borealophlyctis nickersoniae]